MRLAYDNYSPPIQGLQAIDLSTEVRYAPVIDKYDGDRVFKVSAVVDHFDEFQDVKRHTQNDWETLSRHPAEVPSYDGTETVESFPAYPEEVLYVAKQCLIPRAPDINPIEVYDFDGMESFPDPSGQGDFSDLSFNDSNPYNSNYNTMHSMANRWSLNQLHRDVRLQPPFFVLPRGPLPSTGKTDPSAVQLTMFLLCVNHPTEHEPVPHFAGVPGVAVKRPAEFLRRFSATLLWGLQTLKDSLWIEEIGLGDAQAKYAQITTLLQAELGLSSVDDVKPLVDKMIDYLQDLRQQDSKEQILHDQVTRSRPPLSTYDIAVLPSYLEKYPDTLQDDIVHRGLYHACDSQGRERLICRSCYQLLYPLHSAQYIMDHVGAYGDYDAQKGSITLRPQSSDDLQQLCLLDAAKVGCVTELIIDLSWDVSTEDMQSINVLAGRLGLTSLTIATTALAPSDSTSSPSSPLAPLFDESSRSQMKNINQLSHALLQGLKHLCISSHVALDAPALLFELRRLPPPKNVLVVTVKEPSSRCLAGLYKGNIQLLDLGATLDNAKNITTTGYFAGHLQSITITVLESLRIASPHFVLSLLTDTITTILRKNPNLSLLTFYCDARDFRMMEAMMESIYSKMTSEQAPDSRLPIYTLIDNSDDHLVATFKLPNSRGNKAVVANFTTRKNGPGHDAFLDEYGLFIRTLNTNDKFGTSAIDALYHSIRRKRSSQLRNVTISVGDLDPKGAITVSKILKFSNATLTQLVLIGSSVDSQVSKTVAEVLKSLSSVQVVQFDDGSNMEQWIDQVQDSLPEDNSLTVLDRVDDLRKVAPGHDDTSLDWLRVRQARHFSTGATSQDASATSQPPRSSSPFEVQLGYQPTEEQQPLRALVNPKSTIDTTAPAKDEIHAREEVLGDESRLVPFKKVPTELSRTFKSKQGPISSKGYRSITNTSSKPLSSATTSSLVPATSQHLSPSSASSNLMTLPPASIARHKALLSTMALKITLLQQQLERSTDQQSSHHQQLLEQLFRMLAQQNELLQEQVDLQEKEERMLKMIQETTDRLVVTQQQVDAILNQNYELYECLIPRLFVILPYSLKDRDPRNLTMEQFRLYFLCECADNCRPGAGHGTSSDKIDSTAAASTTTIPVNNSIHLARHEGYELCRPTEFFDHYGPYVLSMLRIFKHCLIVTAGAAALADNGLKDIMDGVKSISESTIEAVDMSISFLEKKLSDTDAVSCLVKTAISGQEDDTMFTNPAVLEGADFRRLDTFLRNKDEDKILGNLYRIITERGHVKWICFEHYKETYRLTALSLFVQSVESAGGTYNPHLGQVTIALKSGTASKEFFRHLVSQAPPVLTLDVTLDWDTSSTDLQDLKEAVERSSVPCLVLDLCNKSSTMLDVLTFSGRSEPIVQIMASPKIHTMTLRNTTGFLSQTKKLLKTTLYVRRFDHGEMITSIHEVVKLGKLIQASPSLTDLTCRANNIDLVLDHVVVVLRAARRLRDLNLCIRTRHSEATVKFEGNNGGILSIDLQVQDMETRFFVHRMIKSIHIQGSHELSTLLDRFDRGLKNYAKLESVRIECSSDYPRGWLVAFQTLFAQYPHQTPRFSISNSKSTITADNIQDNESVEEVEEHLYDDNAESPTELES